MKVNKLSRYANAVQLESSNSPEDITILDDSVNVPYDSSSTVHVVTPQQRGRLDMISYIYYGNPFLWWIIARENHIENPLDIDMGDKLLIPSREILYSRGGVLTPW